jgi:Fic family protein
VKLLLTNFTNINQLKQKLDKKRPLPPAVTRNLREVFRVDWTYNSNAIEGNTLTLLETKLVLEEGLTIGGKELREHLEVVNHSEAISYVEELVTDQIGLTEKSLKDIHYLILKNMDNENAGKYRTVNVSISGSKHQPPHFLKVQEEMDALFQWYKSEKDHLHVVELAALFHFKFVYVHPFVDGNGRTARLLMNLILMSEGFPPAIVKAESEKRMAYYQSLERASAEREVGEFVTLIAECVEESLQRFLQAVE